MHRVIISGIGVEIPEAKITNEELVASFNAWVDTENARREAPARRCCRNRTATSSSMPQASRPAM